MKTLIVTAHPSSLGFTHKIADAYKGTVEAHSGHDVEILDLYKEDPKQGFLSFENSREINHDALKEIYQDKIKNADNIVFVHPLWWGSMPAILKNFIDCNFTSGFAYKYINGRPKGLLKGKTASVYITCDGAIWIYKVLGLPFKRIWSEIILRLCGFKILKFRVLDKKMKRTEKENDDFINLVRKDALNVCK